MASAVVMPKAGITVETCIMGKWEKSVGERINVGDILFTYETDKAAFECESTAEGELLEIFFDEGDEVPVLVNVCAIGEKGEDISSLRPEDVSAQTGGPEPAPAAAAARAEAGPAAITPTAGGEGAAAAGFRISPRARDLAARSGVDPTLAVPTGPYGRIIERDVRALIESGAAAKAPEAGRTAVPAAVSSAMPGYTDVKFSGIRRSIAKAMQSSLAGMAQLTHHHTFDASEIMGYRRRVKAAEGGLSGITLTDMILFAVSRTLLNYPDLNANMVEENIIRRFDHVHLGLAVDTPRGLMVPTIFNADTKSLLEISLEAKELAAQVRSGAISPDMLKGGTFTVSNLGMFGVEMFTPVINPPQTGILGVCGTTTRVRETDGKLTTYPAMGLSLTYDHRAVDGAPAARFMSELIKKLENFTILLAM